MNDITKYIFKGIKTDDGKKALSMYDKKTRKTEQFGVNDGEKPPKKRQQRKDPFKWITLYFFTKPTSMWERRKILLLFERSVCFMSRTSNSNSGKSDLCPLALYISDLWCERITPNSIRRRHVRETKRKYIWCESIIERKAKSNVAPKKRLLVNLHSFDLLFAGNV